MRAKLEAGVELEFATPADVRREVARELANRIPLLPHRKAAGVMPSTGILVLPLGCPAAGRIWDVRHVAVSGADPTATITGKAFVCVGMLPPAAQRSGADPLDPFVVATATNQIPADASFTRHEIVVQHGLDLYVCFSGVASGQVMAAHAQIVDEAESALARFTP